jgi:hypothetical protein
MGGDQATILPRFLRMIRMLRDARKPALFCPAVLLARFATVPAAGLFVLLALTCTEQAQAQSNAVRMSLSYQAGHVPVLTVRVFNGEAQPLCGHLGH